MKLSPVITEIHLGLTNRVKELINNKIDTFQCYLHSNKDPKLFNKV